MGQMEGREEGKMGEEYKRENRSSKTAANRRVFWSSRPLGKQQKPPEIPAGARSASKQKIHRIKLGRE